MGPAPQGARDLTAARLIELDEAARRVYPCLSTFLADLPRDHQMLLRWAQCQRQRRHPRSRGAMHVFWARVSCVRRQSLGVPPRPAATPVTAANAETFIHEGNLVTRIAVKARAVSFYAAQVAPMPLHMKQRCASWGAARLFNAALCGMPAC